ncbi:hypothetical protein QAD02_002817 [Eretmocerus hayati]|uniref:Uncharacterized protein n=1 Tax=Eretmocerus hayati TaxID=131215 RepID=A0ACC2NK38_9HYME|nr:hypothetical protein QAD02_002817 [Eretmocerus hayati]
MDSPSHSETTSSARYSGDLETQNAREVIKEVSKTLGVLNTDMRLTHKRCLNENFDQITESLTKKLRILNPWFEESSILAEEARWSAYQIQKIMGVSQATAERTKELVENQGILCLVPSKSGKVLNSEVLEMIQDFYTSDDKSRIQPGKNDYVPVLINRERVEIQKRLLLCNLRECYQNFNDEHPEVSVGFSGFAEAHLPYVILPGATGTHTVCVCKIHQNFKLLIHALDLESIDDQLRKWNYKDILARIICSSPTHECYLRKCPSCPDIHVIVDEITRMLRRESIYEITLKQWTYVDRSALETFTQKLPLVMTTVLQSLPNLLKHDFIAKQQSLFVEEKKKSLAPGEVLAGGDFAENYSPPLQDVVQDHHWNNDQVTIHPWVCHNVDENGKLQHITVVMISDHMQHDYYTVYTFQQHLIKIPKEAIPSSEKKIYVSDGAAGQYKNRSNFQNLCFHQRDFGVAGEWHFFATSHGKGPCDGVGGTLKHAATKASLQRPLDNQITTAEELFTRSQTLDTSMKIIFVPEEETIEDEGFLNERNEGVKTVQGRRSYHSFEPLNEETIRVQDYSSSSNYKDVTIKRKEK